VVEPIPKNTEEVPKKDGSMIYKTMAVSFIGSGIAEFLSLAFYYPFDLIKTRMQTVNTGSQYRYIGTLDATLKIINEGIVNNPEITQKTSRWRDFKEQVFGIRNLYKGGFVFGLSYVAYTAV